MTKKMPVLSAGVSEGEPLAMTDRKKRTRAAAGARGANSVLNNKAVSFIESGKGISYTKTAEELQADKKNDLEMKRLK